MINSLKTTIKYLYSNYKIFIMEKMDVTTKAFEVLEKRVKKSGTSGRVYVPRGWVGKKVKVLLLETLDEDKLD